MNLSELKRADIEDWLGETDWSSPTRKNYLVTLTTIFNFAMKRDYCASNAAATMERPIMDDKPPGILTVEQAVALLAKAVETRTEMIAGLSIGLFGGLRRSEICALDWSEIDIAGRTILVKGTKAKTRTSPWPASSLIGRARVRCVDRAGAGAPRRSSARR